MSGRLIQFPTRNAFYPQHSSDSLARDTQSQAARIAMQVEDEIARTAARMAVGQRVQMAEMRSQSKMLHMPGQAKKASPVRSLLRRVRAAMLPLSH